MTRLGRWNAPYYYVVVPVPTCISYLLKAIYFLSQVGAYLRARDTREYLTGAREHLPALPAKL